jgi:hypothetical protein
MAQGDGLAVGFNGIRLGHMASAGQINHGSVVLRWTGHPQGFSLVFFEKLVEIGFHFIAFLFDYENDL